VYCLIPAIERTLPAVSPRNREEERSRFVLRDQDNEGWAGSSLSPVQTTDEKNALLHVNFGEERVEPEEVPREKRQTRGAERNARFAVG
jgi:hypothetical protein